MMPRVARPDLRELEAMKLSTHRWVSPSILSSALRVSIFAGAGGDEACDWVCMLES